jgi:ferric-dicitrate binding protein FerR (iron transport regulator)
MQKHIHDYKRLAEKYIQNQCNEEEIRRLLDYFGMAEANRLLLEKIREQFHLSMDRQYTLPEETSARIKEKLMQRISGTSMKYKYRRVVFRLTAAAAMLLLLGGIYFLGIHKTNHSADVKYTRQGEQQNDILPGGNRAVLALAGGTRIILDSARNGIVASQGGNNILKVNSGELNYNKNKREQSGQLLYNTIYTPRGGQYQVVLSDGSKVWLNAASSLRFPVSFNGKERRVELTGEAYFEIAENSNMPFKVIVGNMKITVLGTHFNVMAYSDETAIKTTLLEGAVKVTGSHDEVILKPGQQANLYKAAHKIKTTPADTAMAVAWKNGDFSFNNTSIYDIMRQLSRWYDLKVNYEDSLSIRLNGHISRNVKASDVFKILRLTREVNFKIEGREVIVSK